jgi:hypothetical protein
MVTGDSFDSFEHTGLVLTWLWARWHCFGRHEEFSIFSRLNSSPQIEIQSVQYWSLRHSDSFGPVPGDMDEVPIFSRWSTRARMKILIAYLESSWTCEDILFLTVSIFRHMTHGSVILVIMDIFDRFLFLRSRTLFLAVSIYSRGGWLQRWQVAGSNSDMWLCFSVTCGIYLESFDEWSQFPRQALKSKLIN